MKPPPSSPGVEALAKALAQLHLPPADRGGGLTFDEIYSATGIGQTSLRKRLRLLVFSGRAVVGHRNGPTVHGGHRRIPTYSLLPPKKK